ncbi:Kelch domain-containing protein 10 [Thelohanellus kitauei]|uniref:Kelch domain-containing protein 10 n=1 Tax=Thelohanellus kitauei TaxID=669202 RepID=A0A0C2I7I6_THEKT|nr:Kelch domain-containing protein 10 [Thelohanellus kitauei]
MNPTDLDLSIFSISITIPGLQEKRTRKNQTYPSDRFNESIAFSDRFGFLSGGESSFGYESDIWRIDLETFEWIKLHITLQTGIYGHCMAVIDDYYLYSFGGICLAWRDLNTFERFLLRYPPLYRLCLERISRIHNYEYLANSLPAAINDELDLIS